LFVPPQHDITHLSYDSFPLLTNHQSSTEGNRNAGASYVKAIEALMNLEEEVTEENAMSFSKGKTKLPGIGKGVSLALIKFLSVLCHSGPHSAVWFSHTIIRLRLHFVAFLNFNKRCCCCCCS
jgi:hypothetical protein